MQGRIKKRTAFLLVFLMIFSSLQPAFPGTVFADPVTVSSPEAGAEALSTDSAKEAEVSADSTAPIQASYNTAVIEEENAENDVSGNDISANDISVNDISGYGTDYEGEQTGLSTIVIDGYEYGTGALDDEGFEIIAHPEEFDEEEAAGGIADQEKYNADLAYDKMKYISPVRNQGSTGLCWMFGATSAIESNIRKTYGLNAQDELEISPKYGAWWLFHKAKGSLGGYVDNDWIELRNEPKTDAERTYNAAPTPFAKENAYTRRGGFTWCSLAAFSEWLGPVNVDDSNRITYHRKSSLEMLANEPHLTDENPYRQDYQVQNINIYAYPLKGKTRKDLEGMVKNGSAMNAIKDMKGWIASHGALAGSMNTNFLSRDNTFCYDPGDPWPYEKDQNRSTHTTHIISFVGWDDTIPKEWFSEPASKAAKRKYFSEEEFTPPGDGAWICKNSWGTDTGKNGFFYLSYYDGSLRYPFNSFAGYDAVDINRNKTDHKRTVYDNNYQYNSMTTLPAVNDASGRYDHRSYYASAPVKIKKGRHFGAVYTAQSDEKLSAVGIATREENLTFDVDIYTSSSNDLPLDEIKNLETIGWKKEKASSKSNYTVRYAGFHTIPVTPVDVKKGTDFLVIFTMKRDSGGDIIIQEGTDESGKSAQSGRNINVRGKQYYLENEYYHKKASGFSFDDINSNTPGDLGFERSYDYDIKAFTVNAPKETHDKSYLEFYSNFENMDLEVGDTVDMRQGLYFVSVSYDGVWDEIDKWTVSGDETVLRNDGNGVFTALKVSDNAVSVNVVTVSGAGATANIRVIERKPEPDISVVLNRTDYDYTGSPISVKNDVTVTSGNTVIYENGEYTVSGFNINITENGAKDAGEAVATVVVSLSDDSISDNTASENSLLKIADIKFTIHPIDIGSTGKVRDESSIDGLEITEDGKEHKLLPMLILYDGQTKLYDLISRNSADKTHDSYYDYDYEIAYMSADYDKPGTKTIKLTGHGNFTGERYINYRINETGTEIDPTLSENGLYVSKISPQMVTYTGNKHAASCTSKKKSGYNYDLNFEVKYDGISLVEGRDFKVLYYNNLAANIGIADAKEPYLIVKGLGKYKGLSAKRYFAIAPAGLNDENTRVTGLKAVYPVNLSKTDQAVIRPVFTFAVVDDTGKLVNKKLKKAVINKTTGKVTGDYELKYYRFIFYEENEFPSGEETEPPYGEWKEIEGDDYTYSGSGNEDIVLVVAKGINNFSGMSTEIINEKVEPGPWPGGRGMTVVTDSLTCPGKGNLKGSSIKKIDIPAKYKKLTADKRSFTVDELMRNTVMRYNYKNAEGKTQTVDITALGEDFYHYLSVYNSENVEVFEIDQPGSYTVRVTGLGMFKPGQLKNQTNNQYLVAAKDVKLKVSGAAKLKASDFKLQYKKNDTWEDAGSKLTLDYDGRSTEFRVVKKDGSILPEDDYSLEGYLYNNALPGKYTFTLHGMGMYGGSKVTFSVKRKKLDINKALDAENGGKLTIVPSEEYASVFGAMPEVTIKNGYDEDAEAVKVDTSVCSRSNNFSFSGKNNISSGEEGILVVTAEKESPFTGTAKIPLKIVRYDLSKLQGKNFDLYDASKEAIKNSEKVFIYAEDVYSESSVPNVVVYQYDATGMQRKLITLDKKRLSPPVNKGGSGYVVTLNNEADKMGIVDFGSKGTEIPVRVLNKEQKAKKLEITEGDFIEVSEKGAKYTGRAICPSVNKVRATMKDGTVRELEKDEFFVDYESNVSAGRAKVIVYALGKSEPSEAVGGKQVFTFKIK